MRTETDGKQWRERGMLVSNATNQSQAVNILVATLVAMQHSLLPFDSETEVLCQTPVSSV